MAQPLRFAQLLNNQLFPLAQACYDGWMQERAERLNTLELLREIQAGTVDPAQVKVNDDGFEVMPPNPKKAKNDAS